MPQLTINGHPHVFFALWYVFLLLQFVWDKIQDASGGGDSAPPPPPPPAEEEQPAEEPPAEEEEAG